MSLNSMTGFGRLEKTAANLNLVMEMRTLNHRYLDISVSLSRQIPQTWENEIRGAVEEKIRRGRVDLTVNLEVRGSGSRRPRVDTALAGDYYRFLKELSEAHGLPFELALRDLVSLPGVVEVEDIPPDLDALRGMFDDALAEVIDQVAGMRLREGRALGRILGDLLEDFGAKLGKIEESVGEVESRRFEAIARRVRQLLDDEGISADDLDLRNEVALAVQRASIREETARLRSHVEQFGDVLAGAGASGRKLEFLAGEMVRETNTVAAKVSDAELNQVAINMKNLLEDIREQVRNIE